MKLKTDQLRPLLSRALSRLQGLAAAALLAGLAVIPIAPASAAGDGATDQLSREYIIKAAILYKFAKFTEWPSEAFADSNSPLQLCVLGENPFGRALSAIDGKRVKDRFLSTRILEEWQGTKNCHLLFVSESEEEQVGSILLDLEGHAILTVADMPQFAQSGGIISLKTVEDRSKFEINIDAAERAGVRLSSKLLRLADTFRTQSAELVSGNVQ